MRTPHRFPLRVALLCVVGTQLVTSTGWAHWCSNIFGAHARLIIKPEKTSIDLSGGSASLKVFLQNNFPYKLFNVKMQGSASGCTVNVTPNGQTVSPGQQVAFTFDVSGGSGTVQSSALNLQVQIRQGGWQGSSGRFVNPNPSEADLKSASSYNSSLGQQTPSLNAATLADKYPSSTLGSGAPFFGRTGLGQLIHWFGYRFCYNTGGSWRCGSQDCPSPCAEGSAWSDDSQFPQNCMRAGADLGVRKALLGSQLDAARNAAINAMKGGTDQHKCLAAVVGGHLWNGASSTAAFETGLNSVSAACKAAGLRAAGKGTQASCGSGQFYEQAACAAAEGLRGNDGPVTNVLVANAGDGDSCGSYQCLFYAYMLHLVAGDRLAQGKLPSFYPAVGPTPDGGSPPPKKDTGGGPPPVTVDSGSATQADAPAPVGYSEAGTPVYPDGTTPPPGGKPGPSNNLIGGGCNVSTADSGTDATLLSVLLCLGLALLSRRKPSRPRN